MSRWVAFVVAGALLGCGGDPPASPPCETDDDCPSGRYCADDRCERDCTSDEDCPTRCSARGRCEGTSDAGARCDEPADCDDGVFCNGAEPCESGACRAGAAPCPDRCDEDTDRCDDCPDIDGDGAADAACGGTDCDDTNPNRAPGLSEICDAIERDEDCDPTTFGVRDDDGDGSPDARCCNRDASGNATCGVDCDDADPTVSPRSVEVCDNKDNDCDGTIDEDAAPATWYRDVDGDGRGDDASTLVACVPPGGHVLVGGDCDDTTAARRPGLAETCDGLDNDCNALIDDGDIAGLGDNCTTVELGACSLGTLRCSGVGGPQCVRRNEPTAESCNALDDDCDGRVDETIAAIGSACSVPGALGVCAPGRQVCDGAAGLRCSSVAAPTVEQCSAADEDCDGNAYNGFACAPGSTRGCSACSGAFTGTQSCDGACNWASTCNVASTTTRWAGTDPRFTFPAVCTTDFPACPDYTGRVRSCGEQYCSCSGAFCCNPCTCAGQRCVFWQYDSPPGSFDGYGRLGAGVNRRVCVPSGYLASSFQFAHPDGRHYCLAGGGVTLAPGDYRARVRYQGEVFGSAVVLEVHDLTNRLIRGSATHVDGAAEVEVRFTHPTGACANYEVRVPIPFDSMSGNSMRIDVEWIELERLSPIRLPAP